MKHIKVVFTVFFITFITLLGNIQQTWASSNISIYIDNQLLTTDQSPVIQQNRVLVPLRAVFEALGAHVAWDAKYKTITVTKDNEKLTLTIGKKEAQYQNDAYIENFKKVAWEDVLVSDVPPLIMEDRIFVPLRFVAESFNAGVEWDSIQKQVLIKPAALNNVYMSNDNNYTLDAETGVLSVKNKQGLITEIAQLDLLVDGINPAEMRLVLNWVEKSANGGYVVSVHYSFKDVSNSASLAFVKDYINRYYIKGNNIFKTSDTKWLFSTTAETDTMITYQDADNIYLPGENKVLKINDALGTLLKEYDLQDLAKTDKTCRYTFTNGKYMLIRAGDNTVPGVNLYPVLINLENEEVTWLHEKLIPVDEIADYGYKEAPDPDPTLEFKGERNGVLYYTYSPINGDSYEVNYTLP